MGEFDVITFTRAGETITIQRTVGPIEAGHFSSGTWIADAGTEPTNTSGFGVAAGAAYFQTGGATPGEQAELWIDTDTRAVFLEV